MFRDLVKGVAMGLVLITPAMAADVKIGVIDMQKAIMQTVKAKRMSDQFVKDFTKDEEEAKKIQAELKTLNDTRMKAPKAEQDALTRQMQSKNQTRVEITNKIKQAEQEKLQELRKAVDPKIKEVMKEVAVKGGYTIIVDKVAAPFYNETEVDDVTQQATEKLNQALK